MSDPPQYYTRVPKPAILAKNPVTNSLKRAYEQSTANPTVSRGILPNRNRTSYIKPCADDYIPSELSQRTDEMICRFFINNGLTFDSVEDQSLVSFVRVLGGQVALPTPMVMEACVERLAFPQKPTFNFQKAIGPLTATLDTFRHNDEIYLAYSIHYFDDHAYRKNVVFLKKLILCEIDGESVMICVRRAINNFNYGNVKFTNLVVPTEELARSMYQTDSVANTYICSFTYLTRFVEDVLRIDPFSSGLASLRGFILFVRRHADLYSKFRRLQLSKNGDLDLPCLDHSKWTSTTTFLTKCLLLHETFADFAQRWRLTTYITDEVFTKLSYLQRLLTHVQRLSKELSTPDSTSSLVVPTIVAVKGFIESKSVGFGFEKEIKSMFTKHLKPLINGYEGRRYDYACLLDPRYGYRDTIYTPEQWVMIERSLKEEFSKEDMIINDKCPSETIVLKPYAKHVRMGKIEEELSLYRQTLGSQRPPASVNPFVWWGNRMNNMSNLFNKSRELMAPPAVSVDTEIYFGRTGKFSHMCAKMNYQQLENALTVASQQETFKGRGFMCDNFIAPILSQAGNPLKLITESNRKATRGPLSEDTGNFDMSTRNSRDEYLEGLMMQPPPQRQQQQQQHQIGMQLMEKPIQPPPEKKIKIESNPVREVKLETDEPGEIEVKTEIVDEEYEKKPDLIDAPPSTATTNKNKLSPLKAKLPTTADEEKELDSGEELTADGQKRKPCNRRCNICLCVEGHELLKHVTIVQEKLIVLLGMITDGKMSVEEGRYCFTKATKVYICRRHFSESCKQLFTSLNVTNSDEIFGARLDRIKNILEIIEDVKGSPMSALQFKKIFILFSEKYSHDSVVNQEDEPDQPAISLDTLLTAQRVANGEPSSTAAGRGNPDSILPKALRAPRKQVLIRDDTDDDVPIVRRIVSHRPWQARPQSPNCESKFKNPGRCAYCNYVAERSDLLRIPKSEDRRVRWYEKLGEEFEKKVKSVENSFICRTHFPDKAFSSRGRLLKGMLPCTKEDIYSYKLRGDRLFPILDNEEPTTSSNEEGTPEPDAPHSSQEEPEEEEEDVIEVPKKEIKEEIVEIEEEEN